MGVSYIVLQDDRWTGSALFGTRPVVKSNEVDVSALEFQSRFQIAKPPFGYVRNPLHLLGSGLLLKYESGFIYTVRITSPVIGMKHRYQRCMTT